MLSKDRRTNRRRLIFTAACIITTAWLAWQLALGNRSMSGESLISLALLLVCTVLLLWWLPDPIPLDPPDRRTRKLLFTLTAVGLAIVLFAVVALISRLTLFFLPPAALAILFILRRPVSRKQLVYVLFLGIIAAVAALGAGWLKWDISIYAWSALQFALVPICLLAGWAILSHKGLLERGVGWSTYLNKGASQALAAFGIGALIGIPWALANLTLGGASNDKWVTSWWQPFTAIQPGIAEEAWGRVFLVSLLFLVLSRFGRTRTAMVMAVLIVGYWFAYLHLLNGPAGIPSTLLLGTLYSLPLSFIWLRKGLEPAIGFHFCQDFVRFLAALSINLGWWG